MAPEDARLSLIEEILAKARKYAFDFHYVDKDEDWLEYRKEFFKRIKYVSTNDLGHDKWQMDNIVLVLDDIEEEIKGESEAEPEPETDTSQNAPDSHSPPDTPAVPPPEPEIDTGKLFDNIHKLKHPNEG